MSLLLVRYNIPLLFKSSKVLPFSCQIFCLNIKVHTIGRFGETVVTFMFLLSYCAEDLLGVSSPTNHGPSWSSYVLIFTIIIVILSLWMVTLIAGLFPESYSRILKNGHLWKRSHIPNHSQWVHTLWGTQRPFLIPWNLTTITTWSFCKL